jgi:uncharacterized protein YjbI with pentapeptide repeats
LAKQINHQPGPTLAAGERGKGIEMIIKDKKITSVSQFDEIIKEQEEDFFFFAGGRNFQKVFFENITFKNVNFSNADITFWDCTFVNVQFKNCIFGADKFTATGMSHSRSHHSVVPRHSGRNSHSVVFEDCAFEDCQVAQCNLEGLTVGQTSKATPKEWSGVKHFFKEDAQQIIEHDLVVAWEGRWSQ